jgi:tight adherence protein C
VSALAWLAALGAGCGAAAVAALAVPPPRRLAGRVRPYTVVTRSRLGCPPDPVPAVPGGAIGGIVGLFTAPVASALRSVSRLLEARGDAHLSLRLAQAGVDGSPDAYRLRLARAAFVGGAGGLAAGALVASPGVAVLLGACGFVAGASRVRGALDRAIAERAARMRQELYTVNQLLAIHLRTGAGPFQAVQRAVDRGRGAVVAELHAVLTLVRYGMREAEAFRRVAGRVPEPTVARTLQLFAAGAERGADLADGLLALSEDLRDARREELRRQAVRRRAAMLAPTIGILAPIMLLFIAAPLPSLVFGAR